MVFEKFYGRKALLCYGSLIVGIVSMLLASFGFPCDPYENLKWDRNNKTLIFPPGFDSSSCYKECVDYEAYFILYVARHSINTTDFMYALEFLPKDGEVYIKFNESIQNLGNDTNTEEEKLKNYRKIAEDMEKPLEKTPNPFCIFKYLGVNRLSVPPSVRPNVTKDEFLEVRLRDSVGRYGHFSHVILYSIGLFGVFVFLITWFMYQTYVPKRCVMFLFFTSCGCLFAGWMCGVTGALDKLNCNFYGGNKGLEWNITGTKFRSYCGGEYNVRDFANGKPTKETYQTPSHPFLIWWYYYISIVLDFVGLILFALASGLK